MATLKECAACKKPFRNHASRNDAKYCCRSCYTADNAAPTVANDVIRLLGGPRRLAERLDTNWRAVAAWTLNGIPSKHHFEIVRIAQEEGLEEISPKVLQRTITEGRTYRAYRDSASQP